MVSLSIIHCTLSIIHYQLTLHHAKVEKHKIYLVVEGFEYSSSAKVLPQGKARQFQHGSSATKFCKLRTHQHLQPSLQNVPFGKRNAETPPRNRRHGTIPKIHPRKPSYTYQYNVAFSRRTSYVPTTW